MKIGSRFYTIVAVAACALGGCATSNSLYQVEVCLNGDTQKDEFLGFMRAVADDSGLEFIDGSDRYDRHSLAVGLPSTAGHTIYFGAESRVDSGGFTGGNLGLNRYQIGLAMTPNQDGPFNARVIERTINQIIDSWTARRVPADDTFKPRAGCGDGPSPR